jgi:hypothetical protein
MKQALQRFTQCMRKSIIRFFFFIAVIVSLQLAQLHEIHDRIIQAQPRSISSSQEVPPESFTEEETQKTFVIVLGSTERTVSFSLNHYLQKWKSLASLDFWKSPQSLYEKRTSDTFEQALEQYYPGIALTPLSVVYATYGYVFIFLIFISLRFIAWLFFKKQKVSREELVE